MGYFLKLDKFTINQLAKLSCLWYRETHDDDPKEAIIDEGEMTVVVNGDFTECYTFDQLFRNEHPTLTGK